MELNFDLQFLLMASIVALGSTVGTATGFGSSTIIMTFAVLLFPIKEVVPVVIILNLVICTYLVLKHHDGTNIKLLFLRILPLTMLGIPVGLGIFNMTETEKMKPYFGAFVILLSLFELYRLSRQHTTSSIRPNFISSIFWLFTGGIVQGLWVTGGPPIAYWASKTIDNKKEFRSTLSGLWLILNIFLFISHTVTGNITLTTTKASLPLIAPMVVGIVIGERIHNIMPEQIFKALIYIILMFSGTAILTDGM